MPEATGPSQWRLFDQWWGAYPKKTGRISAWEAWRRIHPPPDQVLLDRMLRTLAWQRRDRQWLEDRGQWIPWPANYLDGQRWEDEPFEPQSAMAVRQKPRSRGEAISQQNAETIAKVLARRRKLPEA